MKKTRPPRLALTVHLLDCASADEIVQRVFTKVWQPAQNYRVKRGKFSTWLISISLHECIDELRRRHVRPVTLLSDEELLSAQADTQDAFEQARVREALQQIPI